jgi:hypothetical protein
MNLVRNFMMLACLSAQPLLAVGPVPVLVNPGEVPLVLDATFKHPNNLNEFILPAVTNKWDQTAQQVNAALEYNRNYKQMVNSAKLSLSGVVLAASVVLAAHLSGAALASEALEPYSVALAATGGIFASSSAGHFFNKLYAWAKGPGPVYRVFCNQLQHKNKAGLGQPSLVVKIRGPIKDINDKKILYELLQRIPQKVNDDVAVSLSWRAIRNACAVVASGSVFASGVASLGYLAASAHLADFGPEAGVAAAVALSTVYAAALCAKSMVKFATGPRIWSNPPALATAVPLKEVAAAVVG